MAPRNTSLSFSIDSSDDGQFGRHRAPSQSLDIVFSEDEEQAPPPSSRLDKARPSGGNASHQRSLESYSIEFSDTGSLANSLDIQEAGQAPADTRRPLRVVATNGMQQHQGRPPQAPRTTAAAPAPARAGDGRGALGRPMAARPSASSAASSFALSRLSLSIEYSDVEGDLKAQAPPPAPATLQQQQATAPRPGQGPQPAPAARPAARAYIGTPGSTPDISGSSEEDPWQHTQAVKTSHPWQQGQQQRQQPHTQQCEQPGAQAQPQPQQQSSLFDSSQLSSAPSDRHRPSISLDQTDDSDDDGPRPQLLTIADLEGVSSAGHDTMDLDSGLQPQLGWHGATHEPPLSPDQPPVHYGGDAHSQAGSSPRHSHLSGSRVSGSMDKSESESEDERPQTRWLTVADLEQASAGSPGGSSQASGSIASSGTPTISGSSRSSSHPHHSSRHSSARSGSSLRHRHRPHRSGHLALGTAHHSPSSPSSSASAPLSCRDTALGSQGGFSPDRPTEPTASALGSEGSDSDGEGSSPGRPRLMTLADLEGVESAADDLLAGLTMRVVGAGSSSSDNSHSSRHSRRYSSRRSSGHSSRRSSRCNTSQPAPGDQMDPPSAPPPPAALARADQAGAPSGAQELQPPAKVSSRLSWEDEAQPSPASLSHLTSSATAGPGLSTSDAQGAEGGWAYEVATAWRTHPAASSAGSSPASQPAPQSHSLAPGPRSQEVVNTSSSASANEPDTRFAAPRLLTFAATPDYVPVSAAQMKQGRPAASSQHGGAAARGIAAPPAVFGLLRNLPSHDPPLMASETLDLQASLPSRPAPAAAPATATVGVGSQTAQVAVHPVVDLTPLGEAAWKLAAQGRQPHAVMRTVALQVGSMNEVCTQVAFDSARQLLLEGASCGPLTLGPDLPGLRTGPGPGPSPDLHTQHLPQPMPTPRAAWPAMPQPGQHPSLDQATLKYPPVHSAAYSGGVVTVQGQWAALGLPPGLLASSGWGVMAMAAQNMRTAAMLQQLEAAVACAAASTTTLTPPATSTSIAAEEPATQQKGTGTERWGHTHPPAQWQTPGRASPPTHGVGTRVPGTPHPPPSHQLQQHLPGSKGLPQPDLGAAGPEPAPGPPHSAVKPSAGAGRHSPTPWARQLLTSKSLGPPSAADTELLRGRSQASGQRQSASFTSSVLGRSSRTLPVTLRSGPGWGASPDKQGGQLQRLPRDALSSTHSVLGASQRYSEEWEEEGGGEGKEQQEGHKAGVGHRWGVQRDDSSAETVPSATTSSDYATSSEVLEEGRAAGSRATSIVGAHITVSSTQAQEEEGAEVAATSRTPHSSSVAYTMDFTASALTPSPGPLASSAPAVHAHSRSCSQLRPPQGESLAPWQATPAPPDQAQPARPQALAASGRQGPMPDQPAPAPENLLASPGHMTAPSAGMRQPLAQQHDSSTQDRGAVSTGNAAQDTLARYQALLHGQTLPPGLLDPATLAHMRGQLVAGAASALRTSGVNTSQLVAEAGCDRSFRLQLAGVRARLAGLQPSAHAALRPPPPASTTALYRLSASAGGGMPGAQLTVGPGRVVVLDKPGGRLREVDHQGTAEGCQYTTLEGTLAFIRAYKPAKPRPATWGWTERSDLAP